MRASLAALMTALALAACASAGDRAPPAAGETLPTPYTAAEIEAGNPPGTMRVYLISTAGQEPQLETARFLEDPEGLAHFQMSAADLAGAPLADAAKEGRASWEELRQHAVFPAAEAGRQRTSCIVAAGAFPCWLYTRTERAPDGGAPMLHRFWFADGRAGPPVLYELTRNGELVYRMELVRLTAP
jgi:hypothetical protein